MAAVAGVSCEPVIYYQPSRWRFRRVDTQGTSHCRAMKDIDCPTPRETTNFYTFINAYELDRWV